MLAGSSTHFAVDLAALNESAHIVLVDERQAHLLQDEVCLLLLVEGAICLNCHFLYFKREGKRQVKVRTSEIAICLWRRELPGNRILNKRL